MSENPLTLVALLHGPDQRGLVARASGWIFQRGGNILHADQHRDEDEGVFFQRIEWVPPAGAKPAAEEKAFLAYARDELCMNAVVTDSARRPRVVLFVSKAEHCFHDIVLRWRAGEFPCEIVGVVSNHRDLAAAARGYGLKFFHIPVAAPTKTKAEARQLALLRRLKPDVVVLARYMQVLSAGFLAAFGKPVINIHHSFLP
ncbi:MAG TPA: formyltransferase family protein, partial [Acidobacteriota bacterium]|nr:formyltransferase family protein [Acidobacteriota bacterium]